WSAPMIRSWIVLPVVAMVVGALAASAQTRDRDPDWTAPAKYSSLANPLADRPDTVAGGAKLFQHRCATCHGDEGRGTAKAPNLTVAAMEAQSDGALFWKISSGNTRAGMPAFSFLPELQRWQLV